MILTEKNQINTYRLMSMRKAIELESKGIRFSHGSANAIACKELGLPLKTRRIVTIKVLTEIIDNELLKMKEVSNG